ncbi:MAG: FMN-binding negative transcriptional regulator [Gammaproteobacteria bacterium]
MYTPEAFKEDDPERLDTLMRAYPFALLLTIFERHIETTHLPFLLDAERGERGTLVAHMARANPHWHCFDGRRESLVVFTGPHAYVSPSWYAKPTEVPTWNYAVVHAYGSPVVVAEKTRVRAALEALVGEHEAQVHPPWNTAQAGEDYVNKQMDYIVAFEMPIARLEGKFKLSQNRGSADRAGVTGALATDERESGRETARLMRQRQGGR